MLMSGRGSIEKVHHLGELQASQSIKNKGGDELDTIFLSLISTQHADNLILSCVGNQYFGRLLPIVFFFRPKRLPS